MEVAFRLTLRAHPATVDALYVASGRVADLVAVSVGFPAWPVVFRAGRGFVVIPADRPTHSIPRTVRLRRFAGDLYVPADADLVPALRPDEAVALTRERGLVFLAGGPPLAFDPTSPVAEADALTVDGLRASAWEPFPERPPRADKLHLIRADTPPSLVVEILTAGRPDGHSPLFNGPGDPSKPIPEDARPPGGSFRDRVAANLTLGAGKFLNWLGRSIGASKWAEAGANLARRAIEQVPRLSERVLGAQEAALRELLRQLQSGDVERALRRAPIAVADPSAPSRLDHGSRLGNHDTRYSLRSLLGGSGASSTWLGGGDVWGQLAAQYRRLAEEATRRGDFRRAAYLYGILLRDPRSAARVLDAGGLHRDAAILYRDKVGDLGAAAACFERGACWDEAVSLYVQLEQYDRAGDVYRRIGDEAAALDMFTRAADRLVGQGRYLAAGDLMRDRAGQTESAVAYHRRGWEAHGSDALGCGERILDYEVGRGRWGDVLVLVDEAAERFAPPQTDSAGQFLAAALRHAERTMPTGVAADVRDLARMALADHLRHAVRSGRSAPGVVTTAFGSRKEWSAPVVRDAREAVRLATLPRGDGHELTPFRLLAGPITAAVVSREQFGLVVANQGGAIVLYRGGGDSVIPVAGSHQAAPAALAVNGDARQVVALIVSEADVWLESFLARGSFGYDNRGGFTVGEFPESLPYLRPDVDPNGTAWLFGPDADREFSGPALVRVHTAMYLDDVSDPTVFAVTAGPGRWQWKPGRLALHVQPDNIVSARLPWQPAVPPGSSFTFPAVDWLVPQSQTIELVGIAEDGAAYWSEVKRSGDALVQTTSATTGGSYRAACLIGSGRVAAITADNQVHWLVAGGGALLRRASLRRLNHIAAPVFVAHRPEGNEVVVVFADGWAVRVPKP